MATANRELFFHDPSKRDIPNLGVAKIRHPEDDGDWATLAWELKHFVCEGEYELGLERLLSQYLQHLGQEAQPAAWVSGFYGSGKSHLVRVLEYLWVDPTLPGGESARSMTSVPSEITAHLRELTTAGNREGGLWSAAGTLGAGAGGSVRLAFLNVVFAAAGLPQQFGPAALAIWLKQEGMYDSVAKAIEDDGRSFTDELSNMYVSTALAEALIASGAKFGDAPADVTKALIEAFNTPVDITDEKMIKTFADVMALQSDTEGKLPLTLVVLDEMQQYINENNEKALQVQNLVEACSSSFGSKVLVVATGQSALTANPTLQKLVDRFTVHVQLSDTDVETVVRKVILLKKPDQVPELEAALASCSGEIDRHLGGTSIEAKAADSGDLVRDYPLLPTRRRFWEMALRSIDKAGKAGVLRTQLKIVHDAAASVADKPVGYVIGGEFVFQSESMTMLQSGVLLGEIYELIQGLADGTEDGELASRACSLIFLISQLPQNGLGDIGLRATAPMIADLLVRDLNSDGAALRKNVPVVLDKLAEDGRLLKIGDEYRLQTEEGAEWTTAFNQLRATVRDDAARMSSLRNERLVEAIDNALRGLKPLQGESKVPRRFDLSWNDDEPTPGGGVIPIWIRDEWQTTESAVKSSAAQRGNEDPTIHVLLPKVDAEAIRDSLAAFAAAHDTITLRPEPQTDEGREAKRGMESRREDEGARLDRLFNEVLVVAKVFQSGGNELPEDGLRSAIESASQHSMVRLFPKFDVADNENWDKVLIRAHDGAPDSLAAVGYTGDVPSHSVCREVLSRIAGAGTTGSDVQHGLTGPPYGWPDDAVNGAILALFANGNIRVEREGKPLGGPKELPKTQIGRARLIKEDEPPSTKERLAVRGFLVQARVQFEQGDEGAAISGGLQKLLDLASRSGGEPPLPEPPDTDYVTELAGLVGNQRFRTVAEKAELLRSDLTQWSISAEARSQRESGWEKLQRLLGHGEVLDSIEETKEQSAAVLTDRLLLRDPDPVTPLIDQASNALRAALQAEFDEFHESLNSAISELESSDEWKKLKKAEKAEVLAAESLGDKELPVISTDDLLLAALDATPLSGWKTRRQALEPKVAAARKAAALKREPETVQLRPPTGTLKTEAEVDTYLTGLRNQAMEHIDAGKTIII